MVEWEGFFLLLEWTVHTCIYAVPLPLKRLLSPAPSLVLYIYLYRLHPTRRTGDVRQAGHVAGTIFHYPVFQKQGYLGYSTPRTHVAGVDVIALHEASITNEKSAYIIHIGLAPSSPTFN